MNKQLRKPITSLILVFVGLFLWITCLDSQVLFVFGGLDSQVLFAFAGLIMEITGLAMGVSLVVRRRKSQKKEDEEIQKW